MIVPEPDIFANYLKSANMDMLKALKNFFIAVTRYELRYFVDHYRKDYETFISGLEEKHGVTYDITVDEMCDGSIVFRQTTYMPLVDLLNMVKDLVKSVFGTGGFIKEADVWTTKTKDFSVYVTGSEALMLGYSSVVVVAIKF